MKEAAGEANMTVITIVLIAIVLGVGTSIVNSMMNNSSKSTDCTSQGNVWYNGGCYKSSNCAYDDDGNYKCSGSPISSNTSNTEGQ